MTDILDRIVAIVEAATPIEAPEIPRADETSTKKKDAAQAIGEGSRGAKCRKISDVLPGGDIVQKEARNGGGERRGK